MSAYGLGADVQHIRDHLIGVSLGHHANNFQLSRAEPNGTMIRQWHADQEIPITVYFGIHQNLLGICGSRRFRSVLELYFFDESRERANTLVNRRGITFVTTLDSD